MLGITKSGTKYRKRNKNIRDVDIVKKDPADERLAALGHNDEKSTTSENV